MAMGTATLAVPPMVTAIDPVNEGAASAGTVALIWKIPDSSVGADPEYNTAAFSPFTVTETGSVRLDNGAANPQNCPVTPGGVALPPPVP